MSTMRTSTAQVNSISNHHNSAARGIALLGLLVGFGLRLYRLGQESLWYDEIVSVDLAAAPVASIIEQTARDIHPPGYYLLLHLWQHFATPIMERGYSFEFLQAFPSLFGGVLICALAWRLTRLASDRAAAAVAVWLCAIHPFQITYSQEVRMYTLGAALCALYIIQHMRLYRACVQHDFTGLPATLVARQTWRTLLALSLVTACGLYTFYYFGFVIAVAVIVVTIWWGLAWRQRSRPFTTWLLVHASALLLWLPWLPTFLAQASDPPVPPWRPDWHGLTDTAQALNQVLGVYTAGHALETPAGLHYLPIGVLALFTLLGYANYFQVGQRNRLRTAASDAPDRWPAHLLLLFALGPPALMILLSAAVTPLFHVRYIFVFQLPFLVLAAIGLARLWHLHRFGALAASAGLAVLCFWGSHWFWTSPTMRSDDHRAAVARLAADWKPGEVILANAGWTYRALRVYWPRRLIHAGDALPPPLSSPIRLGPGFTLPPATDATVPLLYTGSIDATGNLGWQHPHADFYAIPSNLVADALVQLDQQAHRIWHYRLYDTVSDPAGQIRDWLATSATLISDTPIAGRDFLRVAAYDLPAGEHPLPHATQFPVVEYSSSLTLAIGTISAAWANGMEANGLKAGQIAYLPLAVQQHAAETGPDTGPDTAASLRLIDPKGMLVAQQDAPLPRADGGTPALSLPVPAGLAPGEYRVQLVMYNPATLEPLAPTRIETRSPAAQIEITGDLLDLGEVQVQSPTAPFYPGPAQAQFDYIHLLEAQAPSGVPRGAPHWTLPLVWWPGPSQYSDTYTVEIRWRGTNPDADPPVAQWFASLGPPHYPSGSWIGEQPVIDVKQIEFAEGLPAPGAYTVEIRMVRAADGLVIPARVPYRVGTQEWVTIGTVQVTE